MSIEKLSISELEKKRSNLKTSASLLAGMIIILFGLSIWNTIEEGEFQWSMMVALSLSMIVFTSFYKANKITKEIESRK